MTMLPDGTYDAFVVDAHIDDAPDPVERLTRLELTITAGERKGEVVEVSAHGMPGEEYELMGMPATLTVTGGVPSVRIDA